MSFMPEIWGGKTLEQVKRELDTKQRVLNTITDYTPLVKNKAAKGYHGPKIGSVAAKDMPFTEFTDPSKDTIDIYFDQRKGVGQVLNDIDDAQTNLPLLVIYTANAKDGLLDSYDDFIVRELIGVAPASNRLSLTGDHLTKADILAIRQKLNSAGAPIKGRTLLVNPTHESDLYDIPDFVSRDKIADSEAMKEGVIGRILGFDVILYSEMPLVNSSGLLSETMDKNVTIGYQSLSYGFGRQKEFGAKTEPKAGLPGDYVNIYSVFGGAKQYESYVVTMRDKTQA